jgi:hypothetical protein
MMRGVLPDFYLTDDLETNETKDSKAYIDQIQKVVLDGGGLAAATMNDEREVTLV